MVVAPYIMPEFVPNNKDRFVLVLITKRYLHSCAWWYHIVPVRTLTISYLRHELVDPTRQVITNRVPEQARSLPRLHQLPMRRRYFASEGIKLEFFGHGHVPYAGTIFLKSRISALLCPWMPSGWPVALCHTAFLLHYIQRSVCVDTTTRDRLDQRYSKQQ